MNSYKKELTDNDILGALKAPFDSSVERKRKGARSKFFTYIPVDTVRDRLDLVLGLNWDWDIIDTTTTSIPSTTRSGETYETPGVYIVGRLTLHLPSGRVVHRDGNGGCSLDKGMGVGDAHKIAASNALKKAAWLFGIGAYLSKNEEGRDDISTWDSDGLVAGGPNNQFQGAPRRQKVMPSNGIDSLVEG